MTGYFKSFDRALCGHHWNDDHRSGRRRRNEHSGRRRRDRSGRRCD